MRFANADGTLRCRLPFRFRLRAPTPASAEPRALQCDRVPLSFDDGRSVEILRVRDPRARRIKLSVSERGVRLTLPQRASLVAGDRFLAEHRDWLDAQLARVIGDEVPELRRDLTTTLPLRGRMRTVRWCEGRFTMLRAEGDGADDALVFQVAPRAGDAALRRALRDFYEAEARADVGRWLPRHLGGLPKAPRRVQFKIMSSQWGSLAPDGSVALDLSLVLAEPEAFEYVLVHELCHLIHHDHSPAYWHEVEARYPEWRVQRDYFREHGRRIKGQLLALLR